MRLAWYQAGSLSRTLPGNRFGSANSAANTVMAMMPMTCQRGRLSMMATGSGAALLLAAAEQAAQQALALGRRSGLGRQHRLVVLVGLLAAAHRFAAGDDVGDRALDDAHPHAFCEFYLQLIVADHLGDQADDAAAGDHAVAALHAGQHLALLLHLGLLWTDQQEVEDDENEDQRKQLDDEVRAATGGALSPRL